MLKLAGGPDGKAGDAEGGYKDDTDSMVFFIKQGTMRVGLEVAADGILIEQWMNDDQGVNLSSLSQVEITEDAVSRGHTPLATPGTYWSGIYDGKWCVFPDNDRTAVECIPSNGQDVNGFKGAVIQYVDSAGAMWALWTDFLSEIIMYRFDNDIGFFIETEVFVQNFGFCCPSCIPLQSNSILSRIIL